MRKILFLLAFCAAAAAHAGLSTINPLIPATNAPLQSAPMRGNFAAAYADVNNLIQQNGAATAPAAPVLGQLWLNTTASPYLLSEWDGAAWAPLAALNTSTHAWDYRGTLNGNTWPTGTGTLSIGAGKTLVVSNSLTVTGTDGSTLAAGTGGMLAYTQNNLGVFAATTSAQLAGVISDETGTGLAVFNSSPTLITPNIGAAAATSIQLNGLAVRATLVGTSGSIGGGALLAGACTSASVSIANSTTSMTAVASPVTYPGDGVYWTAYVSTAGTVVVKVCAAVAATPTASTYNVRVVQ